MKKIYNNDFYCSTALLLVLIHRREWKLSELSLVLPLVTQKRIVSTVNRKRIDFSLFDLIIDKPENFYNFNLLFHSFKNTTLNCIYLLNHSEVISITEDKSVVLKKEVEKKQIDKLIEGNKKLTMINKNGEIFAKLVKDKSNIQELYTMLGVNL
ncbi:three component ABC system middle component [Enterococcus sp. AZ007]|uniref:three component ABC system middle component n=1 Tax=Enterococcus sp. AZ007 TaxID=2774839 RepID=UPI003F1F476D